MITTTSSGGDLVQLEGCLGRLARRVAAAVAARRGDGVVGGPTQGFVIKDRDVDRLLAGVLGPAPELAPSAPLYESSGGTSPLDVVVDRGALDPYEADVLLVAIAPDLDVRYERLYAYLVDDSSRRRPSVDLVIELAGGSRWSAHDRARVGAEGRLARFGLIDLDDLERPSLSRTVLVPDRVIEHVLGGTRPDPLVASMTTRVVAAPIPGFEQIVAAIEAGAQSVWVHQPSGRAGASMAASALSALGSAPLAVDVSSLPDGVSLADLARSAAREALLTARPLLVTGVEPGPALAASNLLDEAPVTVVLVSASPPDPGRGLLPMSIVEAGATTPAIRSRTWRGVLTRAGAPVEEQALDLLARTYHLTPEQILQAGDMAMAAASGPTRGLGIPEMMSAVRGLDQRRLDRLVRRVEPVATLDDLVVPRSTRDLLADVVNRVLRRDKVVGEWGMGRSGRRLGVSCLLSGPSGTGKTLSAEAVAGELGVDLYTIDLSQVVDKYIGETEKNLERVFASAEGVNAVLFFDEADALFGKRSDVRDARDRYANVEVAYLLQRMEQFDGVAMMATNLPANVDDAFGRRIDVIIRYALPDADERRELWRRHLPPTLPLADDVDLDLLASAVESPGGIISNICRSAAFAAAADDRIVTMRDLVVASAREQAKEGRLRNVAAYGPWAAVLEPD